MAYRCNFSRFACVVLLLVAATSGVQIKPAGAADLVDPAATRSGVESAPAEPGPVVGNVPGQSLGNVSDSEIWRAVRHGFRGQVSIPDKKAEILIQSEGETWRAVRNGPVTLAGMSALLGVIGLLAVYFVLRGRIVVEAGASGKSVLRFTFLERFAHWLAANSFVVLALTGLNMLYGRHVLLPVLGPEAFAAITQWGKYAHNYIAFAFMVGLVLIFILWVRQNLPNKVDLVWLSKGGGMFVTGSHPPAGKFNAGQKVIFWLAVAGGLLLGLSGLSLLFPFAFATFKTIFMLLNRIGFDLPAALAAVHEMQLSELLHGTVALALVAVILGHIYLGSIGVEGAFGAMVDGRVDENWAREHHNVWAAEHGIKPSSAERGRGQG